MKRASQRPAGVRRLALALLLGICAAPVQAAEDALVRPLGAGEVDWGRGLVRVRAGAAADLRMPGPDAARADAQRRARNRAQELLREVLADLPLGPGRKLSKAAVEAAVGRARMPPVDYQSNGGVLLALELGFADLDPPRRWDKEPPPGLSVAVTSMPLEARATLLFRKEELTTTALYRLDDPPKDVVRVRRDRSGRLVLPAGTLPPPPQSPVVIYLRTIARR